MDITVVVPTYRRPKDLWRCLEALKQQIRLPDQVLVIVRDIDSETWHLLDAFNPTPLAIRTIKVSVPGQVAALNAALAEAQGDIIAITDDDAAPRPEWLSRIEAHFLSDDRVGGVGGRDWICRGEQIEDGIKPSVGRIQWFGRVIGNHHLGAGAVREVDVLKGANMSYRRIAIGTKRFDERLHGTGAQINNDMAFSLAIKREGWKLIYDPLVAVDHFPGDRFDEDQRNQFNPLADTNRIHNETLVLLEHLPLLQRTVFLAWAILIGTRKSRGLLQCLRFFPTEKALTLQKWRASMQGRWQGWQTWRKTAKSFY